MPGIEKTDREKLDEWENHLEELVEEGGLLLGEMGFVQTDLDEIGRLLADKAFYQLREKRVLSLIFLDGLLPVRKIRA